MTMQITLPFGSKKNAKNLVFTILTKEYPLRLIELHNIIKKRYGVGITFQAVRKAVIQLADEGILKRVADNKFRIDKEWVKDAKAVIDELYDEVHLENRKPAKLSSLSEEINVFTFDSANEMMSFYYTIINDWGRNNNSGINCYQAHHVWEALYYPEKEGELFLNFSNKKIKSYAVITGNTQLDKRFKEYYSKIGVKTAIIPSSKFFETTHTTGTYGDMIIQCTYHKKVAKEIDNFYKKYKSVDQVKLNELSKIVKRKIPCKLTVIKNSTMANQINKSIIDKFN